VERTLSIVAQMFGVCSGGLVCRSRAPLRAARPFESTKLHKPVMRDVQTSRAYTMSHAFDGQRGVAGGGINRTQSVGTRRGRRDRRSPCVLARNDFSLLQRPCSIGSKSTDDEFRGRPLADGHGHSLAEQRTGCCAVVVVTKKRLVVTAAETNT
jgi:hypothetical protein